MSAPHGLRRYAVSLTEYIAWMNRSIRIAKKESHRIFYRIISPYTRVGK